MNQLCFIGDLGLCVYESEASGIKNIKGVMPYIAPELFIGGGYSQQSDIYAFGMIMWEISSGKKAFHETVHDKELALRIFNGLRPAFTDDTPQFYKDLMRKCWNADPTERPSAEEIYELFNGWTTCPSQEIKEQLDKAEQIRKHALTIKREPPIQHSGSNYTSHLMPNISKGKQLLLVVLYKCIKISLI